MLIETDFLGQAEPEYEEVPRSVLLALSTTALVCVIVSKLRVMSRVVLVMALFMALSSKLDRI